jgi:hypothetical protein
MTPQGEDVCLKLIKVYPIQNGTAKYHAVFVVPKRRREFARTKFLVLAHDRRRILHFGATDHPTAEWTAQQIRDAYLWDTAPRYLLRDRDRTFGQSFVDQVKAMGIKQVLSAPCAPWQRAYV